MQFNIDVFLTQDGNFVTSSINEKGQEEFTPTNFSELDDIPSSHIWNMMTRTITQYKFNRSGIMADSLYDILSFVKEEFSHTVDITVMCHKPEVTITFYKQ